ncbi:Serine/threonine-protein kinase 32A [Phytophthora pseudosyringae]|uniref:GDP-D-glucose phosphorylase 1 n=1 Tax=Phytophthora pseudosyringae TaxID=221518 RepID=A0A8T1VG32_9STRA|nr:Serine/threonine-protein kinase 32A [Phytophthora pseudosyringae]
MAATDLSELLLRRWDLAASAGVLRTKVEDTMRRRVPGDLGLVVQFNPKHLKSKRPVDKQLLEPPPEEAPAKPSASGFNFTKAKMPEFLSGLRFVTGDEQLLPSVHPVEVGGEEDVSRKEAEHFVLINVAPLVRGHALFVLEMNLVKPQTMTKSFLLYALSISQAMQREDFALGFNSAGAWSSVNHFHLQGYFFPPMGGEASTNFPIAAQPREDAFRVGGAIVSHVPSWQATCYAVEPEDPANDAVNVVGITWALLALLQSRGIPHNLVIVGLVLFIFPRQPQCENGVGLLVDSTLDDTLAVHPGRLRIAVAELSGLIIAGDIVAYENLTEEMFNSILQAEVSLSPVEEAAIVAEWEAQTAVRLT